jgi:hypothetical protein
MSPHPVSLAALTIALALVASAGQALAADEAAAPTRAEVKASVLAARAHHELKPAGEATQPFAAPSGGAARSFADVRSETLEARAHGMLVPAGEGSPALEATGTRMARADVKESTHQARLHHELVPAGEGFGPTEQMARGPLRRSEMVAIFRH